MPKHHEYVCDRFVVSPKRKKTFAQRCTHKNYGMTFQDLPIAAESVSIPVCTIQDPDQKLSKLISEIEIFERVRSLHSQIHAKIPVPYNHKVINRFGFVATKLYALCN